MPDQSIDTEAYTELKTETITVNFGPQHPSTHGVLYLEVELDGEVVVNIKSHIGYLHRCVEKLAEARYYNQVFVLLDRTDYIGAFFNEWVYALAVEKLMGVKVPSRAEWLRIIMAELNRISSHLFFYGTYGLDVGALTPAFYGFREREKILDLFELVAGYRMTPNYLRVGGVVQDAPEEFFGAALRICDEMPHWIDEYNELLTGNEIFQARTENLDIMKPERAIEWGLTGPVVRAMGLPMDVRKDEPYGYYDKVDFDVVTKSGNDLFDAYRIRLDEIMESVKIIKQAIEQIEPGPIRADVPLYVKPPKGEAYARVESPRGEQGVWVVSDGSDKPYRMKFRSPCLVNLSALPEIANGWKIADLVAYIGILDIVLGEVDR